MEWLMALWVRKSSRPVWVKLPVLARVTKARSCLLSNGFFMYEQNSKHLLKVR